ncbi:lens fiber major intrinsic protein-like [Hydractinia symbiolongicarpus]|uniref:lens fiber major intrinsic protein-like n=1 Tax=Hydractinia symbiolongicarpus TaxID=13093 RepID=UPI00254BFC26|nr:lens fiber major intrinsic protein-like [Hydractinia symbiolongicarpus]
MLVYKNQEEATVAWNEVGCMYDLVFALRMANEEDRKISTYETYVSSPNERTVLIVRPRQETWQEQFGMTELKSLNFWKSILAEFVLTLLFILVSCGCTLTSKTSLHQGICVGYLVSVLIAVSLEQSGYFNPAISFGLLVARTIKVTRFLFYVAAQIAGGLSGAGLLYLYTPREVRQHIGVLSLNPLISDGIGFVIEMTLTFLLMWTVLATRDRKNGYIGFQAPLAIGFSVTVGIMLGLPFTGAAMNPVRAFAPGIIMNQLSNHWVYWVGPLVGALLGSLSYEFVFKLENDDSKRDIPTVQLNFNSTTSNL